MNIPQFENLPASAYDHMAEQAKHTATYPPHLGYETYCRALENEPEKPSVYASMAITSGGYKRDSSLDIGDVIRENTSFGNALRSTFNSLGISPQEIIIPSELGSMEEANWNQFDYLAFCFHILSGVTPEDAKTIESILFNHQAYSDASWKNGHLIGASREQKSRDYLAFTNAYVTALQNREHSPVKAIVGALDCELSLGAEAEKHLGSLLNIPFYSLEIQQNYASPELQVHTQNLHKIGASAVKLADTQGPAVFLRQ